MLEKSVLFRIDGETRVATLTLNRPDKLNSFTREMHREIGAALTEIEGNQARALIITGTGRGFCAGQDLADLDFTPGAMSDLSDLIDEHFNSLVRRLQASPLSIIAAVNGTAAGAGANLAMACDLVVAARSASFIQALVKIGLLPDSGGTWLLPRRVGEARALGLALTGEKLSAEKAEAWGIIWRVVDDGDLQQAAAQLTQMRARAITAIKRAMQASANNTFNQQLDLERDLQRELSTSPDYIEGVAAFREKRALRFEGL
ncbi:Enoyl-CoA hydratase [Candidatus Paraburkholderia calva]|nr:Enoyl-CoA hydratase [Candidatus Paraburkholderia calva]